tara:strand:- start:353 stop:499 length:147 start_codon:yes stop_codon:yes gene_type:complete
MSAKLHLCDGDCGNAYEEKHLNRTCYGDDFCNDCMCDFIREQDHEECP